MYIIINNETQDIEKAPELTQDDKDLADDGVLTIIRMKDAAFFYNGVWNDILDRTSY